MTFALVLAATATLTMSHPALALTRLPRENPTATFEHWQTLCRDDGTTFCNATTRHDGKPTTTGGELGLEVFRASLGRAFEVALVLRGAEPDQARPIRVRVDRNPMHSLAPRADYAASATPGRYEIATQMKNDALVALMRTGTRMYFFYTDMNGADLTATFALGGLADALAFIEREQPKLRVRPTRPALPIAPSRPRPSAPRPYERPGSPSINDAGLKRESTALEECWSISDDRSHVGPCLERKLAAARADMREIAERLASRMRELDRIARAEPGAEPTLVESQRAFSTFANAECQRRAASVGRDTGAQDFRTACLVDMTRQRTDVLRAELNRRR